MPWRPPAGVAVGSTGAFRLGACPTNLAEAQALGGCRARAGADAFAANVLPVVRDLQAAGVVTVRAIAEALNLRGILMARWRVARF